MSDDIQKQAEKIWLAIEVEGIATPVRFQEWIADALRLRRLLKYVEASEMGHSAYACGKEAGCCCGLERARDDFRDNIAAHDELFKRLGGDSDG